MNCRLTAVKIFCRQGAAGGAAPLRAEPGSHACRFAEARLQTHSGPLTSRGCAIFLQERGDKMGQKNYLGNGMERSRACLERPPLDYATFNRPPGRSAWGLFMKKTDQPGSGGVWLIGMDTRPSRAHMRRCLPQRPGSVLWGSSSTVPAGDYPHSRCGFAWCARGDFSGPWGDVPPIAQSVCCKRQWRKAVFPWAPGMEFFRMRFGGDRLEGDNPQHNRPGTAAEDRAPRFAG